MGVCCTIIHVAVLREVVELNVMRRWVSKGCINIKIDVEVAL